MNAKISYTGKKVSIGIDLHKKSFTISAVCEGELIKRLNTKPLGDEILKFIETRFHTLGRIGMQFEKLDRIRSKVKGAMMYPLLTVMVAIVVLVFLLVKVIPEVSS